eukprot:m.47561 g.47561  ORF g.47561 m.47561 type:complete len:85 (+) comp6362_c0_seq3:828-1082(+)
MCACTDTCATCIAYGAHHIRIPPPPPLQYAFQFHNAYTLAKIAIETNFEAWNPVVAAVIFAVLFLGNAGTTAIVVRNKFKPKTS